MKLWIKYLLAVMLGVLFSIVLPSDNETLMKVVSFLTDMVIRVGRYIIIPLVFFTAITSFNKLRSERLLIKLGIWMLIITIFSSLILTLLGTLSGLFLKLPRIPIMPFDSNTLEKTRETLSAGGLIQSLFPFNAFQSLTLEANIFPVFFFALLLGSATVADRVTFKPVVQLADSLSRLMYNIAVLFSEFLSFGMVIVVSFWCIKHKATFKTGLFTPLILTFLFCFLLISLVLYPLIVRFLCHDRRPFRVLYASLCSLLAAFFTGDNNFVLALNTRHAKESLGVRRRINGSAMPIFTVFMRGGEALTSVISFVVIYRSYSSLAISIPEIIKIFFVSFGLSFLLGGIPVGAAFINLQVLCAMFGRGFENGYLLLSPLAPIISSFALLFDVLSVNFGTYIVAVKTKNIFHHALKNYI